MIARALAGIACALAAQGGDRAGGPDERRLPLLLETARDATGEGIAFVELSAERREVYLGETVRARLAFGVEEELLETRAVQPFGVRLDLPVQVVAPWIDGLARARVLGLVDATRGGAPGGGASFALNEGVRRARPSGERTFGGRRFRAYEIAVELAPAAVGELAIPAPSLGLAYATRFEESAIRGRVPLDRVDAYVTGEPLELEVRPLPEEGRPPDFGGAVGSFRVRAEVGDREVAVGESLELALTIEGEGDLDAFAAPEWDELGGFRVLGILDERTPGARVLTLDLAPRSEEVWQIPPIPFPHFDPGPPAGYRIASTRPIDVEVRAAPAVERASADAGDPPLRDRPAGEDEAGVPARAWLAGAAILALATLAAVLARRRA